MEGPSKMKSKRLQVLRRSRLGDPESNSPRSDIDQDAMLPPRLRSRLYDLFGQIEREFETVYADNIALQEKLEVLTERLDQATGGTDKNSVQDNVDDVFGAKQLQAVKRSGHQISQRLKLTYKTSTSKIVSSFKTGTATCRMVREFRGHRDGVWEVGVSKTDPQVIGTASADHTAAIWFVDGGTCLLQYTGHTGSVNSIRFHPNQELVVTASGDNTAHIWKCSVTKPVHVENNTSKNHSSEDEIDSNERDDTDGMDSSDDKIEPTYIRQPSLELLGHNSVVIATDWMSGGNQVITASWDRMAHLHDAETGEIVSALSGHDQELTNICAHPSQRLMVTASKDTTFRLWDFRDHSMKVNVFQGHTQPVTSAVFGSSDLLVSGSDDRTVKVWDLRNMRSPITTIRTDSAVNRLAISMNSSTIAIPQDNRHIRLHDVQGVRLARFLKSNRQGHSRMVCSVAWADHGNDDGKCDLYSCGFDRHIFGWKIKDAKE